MATGRVLTQSQLKRLVEQNTERGDDISKRVAEVFASQLDALRKRSDSRLRAAWDRCCSTEYKQARARERHARRRRP